jgi:hypothetical protein
LYNLGIVRGRTKTVIEENKGTYDKHYSGNKNGNAGRTIARRGYVNVGIFIIIGHETFPFSSVAFGKTTAQGICSILELKISLDFLGTYGPFVDFSQWSRSSRLTEEKMSMIDPKGSRQELEAMAIIRAHRALNRPLEASALAAQPPHLIVLPIPGFWKSLSHQMHIPSPENSVQVPGE